MKEIAEFSTAVWRRPTVSRELPGVRQADEPFRPVPRSALPSFYRTNERKVSPPSQIPSKAITPSAKSPPAASGASPASTAGRLTATLALSISRRTALAMSGAEILYPYASTQTSSQSAGRAIATSPAFSSSAWSKPALPGIVAHGAATDLFAACPDLLR